MGGAVNWVMARALRNHPTDTERALWRHLWQRQFKGLKFRRQQPIGSTMVDFVCLERKLILEIDGGQHAAGVQDLERTTWLEGRGFRVLRFWNNQVLSEIEAVTKAIWEALSCPPFSLREISRRETGDVAHENGTPPPSSSPSRGEEKFHPQFRVMS